MVRIGAVVRSSAREWIWALVGARVCIKNEPTHICIHIFILTRSIYIYIHTYIKVVVGDWVGIAFKVRGLESVFVYVHMNVCVLY